MKKDGETKPSLIKSLFSKKAKEQRKAYVENFNAKVENIQNEQIDNIARKFQETGKLILVKDILAGNQLLN